MNPRETNVLAEQGDTLGDWRRNCEIAHNFGRI